MGENGDGATPLMNASRNGLEWITASHLSVCAIALLSTKLPLGCRGRPTGATSARAAPIVLEAYARIPIARHGGLQWRSPALDMLERMRLVVLLETRWLCKLEGGKTLRLET